MFQAAIFAERLGDFIFENETNGTELAKRVGTSKTSVSRYLRMERVPSVEILVRIADAFRCSLAYLIGIDNESYSSTFVTCPPFSEQFQILLRKHHATKYRLIKETRLSESIVYSWQKGETVPTIDSVIRLADFFQCSVDCVVGREK